MANPKKRSSLSEAFGDVASRKESMPLRGMQEEEQSDKRNSGTREAEMVPVRGGQLIAASTPVNMTFTVTAKERYEWSLELKRRGLSAVSVLREAMNELLIDSKE